ncbi:MAG: hypothetical protein Ct9H90mP16_05490 [Candidatus Poseidoniales archaeon]|nr:MAG: hypothetical protein Ct9H90mP16_05490 [Candidatus Poseidoniales archaeon]
MAVSRWFGIEAIAGTQNLGEVEFDLGPGMIRWASWDWTPINEGNQAITIRIDPDNLEEEIDEDNNMFEIPIAVSAPVFVSQLHRRCWKLTTQ